MTANMGTNALLLLPAGFNPASGLAGYSGLVHVAGTTLTVPAGQGFSGWGTINDPVVCQGTIAAAANGAINLTNGLASPAAAVSASAPVASRSTTPYPASAAGRFPPPIYTSARAAPACLRTPAGRTAFPLLFTSDTVPPTAEPMARQRRSALRTTQYVGYSGTGVFTHRAERTRRPAISISGTTPVPAGRTT